MEKSIPLEQIKIVKNRIEILYTMGIDNVKQLLETYPYRYEIIESTPLIHDEKVTIEAKLLDTPKFFFHGRVSRMSFQVLYQEQTLKITLFNRHFLKKNMIQGMELTITGKYNESKQTITASELRLKPIAELASITPIYSVKEGITQTSFQGYIKKAMAYYQGKIQDDIPSVLLIKHNLIHKELAIQLIHFPTSTEDIKQALRHLKYEEFLKFQLTMLYIKLSRNKQTGIPKVFDNKKIDTFIEGLPFSLTTDQISTYQDVLEDLSSDKMMYRFVQGDVGSGKTIVGAIAMYASYLAGFQSAFMAPTEILASQHFQSLSKIFKDVGVKITLLTGHLSIKEKREIYEQLENGEIDIVVGTHALFQEKVIYKKLGFVITDEQHRFGVNQRKALKDKGEQVDFLVMSATPIPRTLAISLYGDMEVSTIKTMPKGRKEVKTEVIKSSSMKPILSTLKEYLSSGGQCYVVCPLVEESETLDSRNATSIYQGMKKYFTGTYEVGLLHGKMPAEEKESIMEAFKNNEIQILVSTTVIEVGVDVKNANMMVIYNAERFGLSQLHQLRGRVGRGDQQGYCYLLSNSNTPEAKERLNFLKDCHDGFELSAFDLKLRGPGDILGNKQSGLPIFLVADIFKDFNILEVARRDASDLLHTASNDSAYLRLIKEIETHLIKNNQYVD
ncbi:MAG: ATP-dependent DNA helicase RecG [Coprobacillaceae bacterium]